MWDKSTTFSDKQTLASGANSENVVDAGPDDIALGAPVYLQLSLAGAPATELTVDVQTADTAAMTTPTVVARFKVAAATVARGGVVLAAPLPTGCRRYLRLSYTGPVSGKVTAGLVEGAQTSGMR